MIVYLIAFSGLFHLFIILCSLMSIYSGFPTRRDEEKYNGLLSKLILTLQTHLLELIGQTSPAQSKVVTYSRIIAKMKDYEEHKYLPPKFTELLTPLCKAMGISAATEQKVSMDYEEKNNYQGVKASSHSLQRQRVKSQFQLSESEEPEGRPKIDSMVLPKQMFNQTKKTHFQSSHQLKERKFNPNLPPKDHAMKSTDQADEPVDHLEKWATLMQTRTTKGGKVSKLKTNLRYQRAFHGFHEAQENFKKGQQKEEQRKIKTTESQPQ